MGDLFKLSGPSYVMSAKDKGLLTVRDHAPVVPCRQTVSFDPASPIVAVHIGSADDNPVTFHVHKEVLERSSGFLQAKVKEVWFKPDPSVKIPNHSSAAFRIYVNWIYSGFIIFDTKAGSVAIFQTDTEMSERAQKYWLTLTKAYVLGEELIDPRFQHDILTSLKAVQCNFNDKLCAAVIGELSTIIYEGTPEGSPARDFLVTLYAFRLTKKELSAKKGDLAADFVFELLMHKLPV